MPVKNTLESKITYRVKRSKTPVFVRDDFKDIGGYDQVGRILRGLVKKGVLVSLGYGAYARSKRSSVSGAVVPEKPLPELAKELLKKLGVKVVPSSAERAYNSGKTTQVPTGRVIGVKGRIVRRIGYNGRYISFEKVS
ncbi:DUF6088 family protein [Desulfatibacillum aliphaticivorans]|uniref:S-adenosylhomocysteine hydrolase n=1 Tax=Desulfatibacillum aliphaticivorans TaxID=218208 RepID=B8F9A7_DESAL|nr:DUF6088 family protein [Desulfatibacillum aliphaticivorans]ACL02853.1 conserved hypothetical protein [Desulfatibacillum aliphaticivorans]